MKREVAILAAVAVGSMAVGFLIVLLLLGPGEGKQLPDPFSDGQAARPAPAGRDGEPPAGKVAPAPSPPAPGPAAVKEEAVETPPPQTNTVVEKVAAPPAGKLALDVGEPFIWRCWPEGQGDHLEKDRCGVLPGVEAIVKENLGAVEACVLENAGAAASGKLSLALKLDFSAGKVNAWLGNSTTVEKVEDTSACLRKRFEELAPPDVGHDHPRYIVFFTVTVG